MKTSWLYALGLLCVAAGAGAHVSVVSGPATAASTQEIAFGVGHGCEGRDTFSVRVEIPAGVTSVRAIPNTFGRATLEKDASGLVTAVTWQKSEADVLAADDAYYKLALRMRVPNQPFTKLYFPARQACRTIEGATTTVDWVATTPSPDGGGPEPAPELLLAPAHKTGWNKLTVSQPIADLAVWFAEAAIVWRGDAAYSANSATAALIEATEGIRKLETLEANDEIWVKY